MSDGVYSKLAARFDKHQTRKQGGQDLTYLTGEQVITRLNETLGVAAWSFAVVREGVTDVEAWVLGELTATIDGTTVTRQHYGNQDLTRGTRATSDLFKSAATDAMKKAATTIGIGLYLYDADERREIEAEMREAARPKPTPMRPEPPKPTTTETVRAAAMVTGAAPQDVETVRARWARLVAEAERTNLPTWRGAKSIDASLLSDAQITKYADTLEQKIAAHKAA